MIRVFLCTRKRIAKNSISCNLYDLVPQNHILRLIYKAIDFSFIYDEVDGLYAAGEKERPGMAPVVLFKIIFIQYLFGIRSMRQAIKEI